MCPKPNPEHFQANRNQDPYLNADGIGHLTTEIWWSMIEMGISIVAACLPTIRPLFGKLSPDRILHSIRSMFSLQSLTSLTPSARRRAAGSEESLGATGAKYKQFSDDQVMMNQARQKSSGENGEVRSIRSKDLEG